MLFRRGQIFSWTGGTALQWTADKMKNTNIEGNLDLFNDR